MITRIEANDRRAITSEVFVNSILLILLLVLGGFLAFEIFFGA